MIDKKQDNRERKVRYNRHGFLFPLYAIMSFFLPWLFPREVEPFELPKVKPEERIARDFIGATFRRVKKVGNFFAYAWVKNGTEKRCGNCGNRTCSKNVFRCVQSCHKFWRPAKGGAV